MHDIATKHCLHSLRPYPYGYVSRGMTWSWLQRHLVIESMIHIDKHSPTSLDNGQYIPIRQSSMLIGHLRYGVKTLYVIHRPHPPTVKCINLSYAAISRHVVAWSKSGLRATNGNAMSRPPGQRSIHYVHLAHSKSPLGSVIAGDPKTGLLEQCRSFLQCWIFPA
jgi:hypothetical protein